MSAYTPSLTHPQKEAKHAKLTKVLASTNPEQLTTDRRMFVSANFTGRQSNTSENASDIFIGWDSSHQPIKIPAGSTIGIEADKNGAPNNFEKIWVRGDVADGLIVNFIEGESVS
jgi:hypothetical protein